MYRSARDTSVPFFLFVIPTSSCRQESLFFYTLCMKDDSGTLSDYLSQGNMIHNGIRTINFTNK